MIVRKLTHREDNADEEGSHRAPIDAEGVPVDTVLFEKVWNLPLASANQPVVCS